MKLKFACPKCNGQLECAREFAGKPVQCALCKHQFTAPQKAGPGNIAQVVKAHSSDANQGLFIQPHMNLQKASSFSGHVTGKVGREIDVNDIFVLVDNTFLGTAEQGLAITSSRLILSFGDLVGIYELSAITSVEVWGWINKKMRIGFTGAQIIAFELSYLGGKNATVVAEILNQVGGT